MRAITVKQPWAWCIAEGTKRIENRSRPQSYRGPLAIHAGQTPDEYAFKVPAVRRTIEGWRARHPAEKLELTAGAILAVARLTDCHASRGCCAPWGEQLIYHLVLEDVTPLPRPVPYRGALGLWKLPDELATTLLRYLPPKGAHGDHAGAAARRPGGRPEPLVRRPD